MWLHDWEHQCCGEARQVGQNVTLIVFRSHGRLWEQRHDYGNAIAGSSVQGHLVGIEFHPAEIEQIGPRSVQVIGYGPGLPLDSTDVHPGGLNWAIEFLIETSDDLPNEGVCI
ncbi:MAG: hypothetical protein ACLQPH_07795 [Acidimicrobiales bacterium]